MRIAEHDVGEITVLTLSGRLILDEGELKLRDAINALVAKGRVKLIVDMKDVTRMDSAGIGMLVAKLLTVMRKGGNIKLLQLTDRTDRMLGVTRLASVFELFEHEDQAIASFATDPYPPFFRKPSFK